MAGLSGAFAGIRGNAVLQQIVLFQIVGQLIGPAITPFADLVLQEAYNVLPTTVLSPADLAEAVLRGAMAHDAAAAEARLSGFTQQRFDVLALLAGNAPDPTSLAIALRRGLINHDRYLVGVAQGRMRNEWADLIQQLSVVQPSPEAMLNAELEGQLSHADALAHYQALGGDPAYYDIMFNTQGQAPSPVEALELANRGIIPWTGHGPGVVSYEQAFLEGPWRNKWLQPFQALGVYLPPPRTVVAMLRAGSISQQQAADWLSKQGLEKVAVAAYIADASAQKTAATKNLSQTIVLELYRDRIINKTTAATYIQDIGYSSAEANYIIAVEDARLSQHYLSLAVGRIQSRYTAWRIDRTEALSALTALQVDPTGISDLLGEWDIVRTANAPVLTAAQVGKLYETQILDQNQSTARLKQLGYSDLDAWLYLSQHIGAKLPNPPSNIH